MFQGRVHVHNNSRGQLLLEVVVSLGIAVVVLLALVNSLIIGLKNAQFSRDRATAEKLAQEGIEWVRSERDRLPWLGSGSFTEKAGKTYCLNSIDVWPVAGGCLAGSFVKDIFQRNLVLSLSNNTCNGAGSDAVKAVVTINWSELGKDFTTAQTTCFTNWQKK